ncbi:hypothetical protein QC763_0005480 [Podospora pseudopauciseta]|uniref:Uncharacterized protein n=1 Tax=Podospora pseudopauciseta TaxID=2093780 RepID=A0ABR0HWX3_9PEZI|nr:hypothetical protein QC763_0005480 [Podospora pseudopauciseta]
MGIDNDNGSIWYHQPAKDARGAKQTGRVGIGPLSRRASWGKRRHGKTPISPANATGDVTEPVEVSPSDNCQPAFADRNRSCCPGGSGL